MENYSRDYHHHSSTSDEDSDSPPTLYQYQSPPKVATSARHNSRNIGAVANAKKSLLSLDEPNPPPPTKLNSLKGKVERPNQLSINGAVYNPLAYRSKADSEPKPPTDYNSSSDTIERPSNNTESTPSTTTSDYTYSGADIIKRTDILQPHPPGSPKISSRPGSGRLRSRHGSRASNHSNKPTPESSGTGEELKKALGNPKSLAELPSIHKPAPDVRDMTNYHTSSEQAVRLGGNDKDSPSSSGSDGPLSARLSERNALAAQKMIRTGDALEGTVQVP